MVNKQISEIKKKELESIGLLGDMHPVLPTSKFKIKYNRAEM